MACVHCRVLWAGLLCGLHRVTGTGVVLLFRTCFRARFRACFPGLSRGSAARAAPRRVVPAAGRLLHAAALRRIFSGFLHGIKTDGHLWRKCPSVFMPVTSFFDGTRQQSADEITAQQNVHHQHRQCGNGRAGHGQVPADGLSACQLCQSHGHGGGGVLCQADTP